MRSVGGRAGVPAGEVGPGMKVLRSKLKSLPILGRAVGRAWLHSRGEEMGEVTCLRLCVGRSWSTGGCLPAALPGLGKAEGGEELVIRRPDVGWAAGAGGGDGWGIRKRRCPPQEPAAPAPSALFSFAQWTTRSCADTRPLASSLTSTRGRPSVSGRVPLPVAPGPSVPRALAAPFHAPPPHAPVLPTPQTGPGVLSPNTTLYFKKYISESIFRKLLFIF